MQIGAGLHQAGSAVRVVHPVDLLDASYAAAEDIASSHVTDGKTRRLP
jgi:hypothetical protein